MVNVTNDLSHRTIDRTCVNHQIDAEISAGWKPAIANWLRAMGCHNGSNFGRVT